MHTRRISDTVSWRGSASPCTAAPASRKPTLWIVALAVGLLAASTEAEAHCDSLDGPVITDARRAIASKDITPVLKWVKAADEKRLRAVFAKTLRVRRLGTEALELADRHFFETLVRIHRASEGAPYTGLKPPGTTDTAVRLADMALEKGTAATLTRKLSEAVAAQLHKRYQLARSARLRSERSAKHGRAYVAAYVSYVHFVETLHKLLKGQHAH